MPVQGYLTKLDMGELVSAGMVSINVLFSSDIQVCIPRQALRAADTCGQGTVLEAQCRSPSSPLAAPRSFCCALRVFAAATHGCSLLSR